MKLSHITPEERRITNITTRGRTIIRKYKISTKKILTIFDVTLVMRKETTSDIVPRSKTLSTRIPKIKEIMLRPSKTMNQ